MLRVTETAEKKIIDTLSKASIGPLMAIRIIRSNSDPNKLLLVLDKQRKGDQVVRNKNGRNILFIEPKLVPELEGVVFDCKEKSKGYKFTVSRIEQDK